MKVLAEGVETDEQRGCCGLPAATRCRAICSPSLGPAAEIDRALMLLTRFATA
jgi:hypothetical protein